MDSSLDRRPIPPMWRQVIPGVVALATRVDPPPDNVRISRIRLGWTSGNMGSICEDQAKILVEEYVQRCRGVHGKL